MKTLFKKVAGTLLLSLWALSFNTSAWAQAAARYPDRPVKLLVSFPPGGFADLVGRSLAQALTQAWGQPVIVDNRPGAAGILASDVAAKAVADGYTLYLATDGPFVINPYIYSKLPYDPVNSFMPAALVANTSLVLVVNTEKVSAKTLAEFVTAAHSNPKPLDYASGGAGGPHHLSMEALKTVTGINLTHIPYKGGAPALQAVLAGEVSAAFSAISTSLPHEKAGKIRILASGGQKRSLLAPDIPTIAESGYPGFDSSAWAAVVAPKGTPPAIVQKIEADVLKITRDPQFAQTLLAAGIEPWPGNSTDLSNLIKREQQRNSKLIRDLNIKAE